MYLGLSHWACLCPLMLSFELSLNKSRSPRFCLQEKQNSNCIVITTMLLQFSSLPQYIKTNNMKNIKKHSQSLAKSQSMHTKWENTNSNFDDDQFLLGFLSLTQCYFPLLQPSGSSFVLQITLYFKRGTQTPNSLTLWLLYDVGHFVFKFLQATFYENLGVLYSFKGFMDFWPRWF